MDTRLETQGYLLLDNALSTEAVDLFSQYALFDELHNKHSAAPEKLVPNSYGKEIDPFAESLTLKLLPIMQEYTGLSLSPTFTYFRVYRTGSLLPEHKDRPACEYSATVCFNYDYSGTDYQWPIYMDNNPVVMKPGDMVIYRGCEVSHRRDTLEAPEGSWHVQCFFHYVDLNGPYANLAYDRRRGVGYPRRMQHFRRV